MRAALGRMDDRRTPGVLPPPWLTTSSAVELLNGEEFPDAPGRYEQQYAAARRP